MSSYFLAQSLLLCLLVYAGFTHSKVHYIRSSLDSPCPQNASSCLTLSQFAANSSHNETDISLLFLPGNHTLDQELLLAHGHNFSMSKYVKDNETVFVECISQLGKFNISEATSVSIKSLHFIGCGSNRVSQVTRLTIADSIFQDVKDKSTVLELNKVNTANIERSRFFCNTLEHHTINSSSYIDREEVLDYVYYHRNRPDGVLYTVLSNISIIRSTFMHNRADVGGALVAHNSSVHIDRSTLSYNTANFGGAMVTSASTIDIDSCSFTGNIAHVSGGVMVTNNDKFTIWNSTFTNSNAFKQEGGVMVTFGNSSLTISNSAFTSNNAIDAGVIETLDDSSFAITKCNFTSNYAKSNGGVMSTRYNSSFIMNDNIFTSNIARNCCGIMITYDNSSVTISNSTFYNNSNVHAGTELILYYGILLNIFSSNFVFNAVHSNLTKNAPMIYIFQCSMHITNSRFDHNFGSSSIIYVYNSNLTLSGETKFEHSKQHFISNDNSDAFSIGGGVITSYQSTVIFAGDSTIYFSSNQARDGGAILAIESTIIMYGKTTIANNNLTTIANSSGGGISLKQSRLEIKGNCTLFNNSAMRGGGIHATSSTISVYQPATLKIINNNAELGGGMYLEVNSKIYVLKKYQNIHKIYYLTFIGNHANYGGAVYVADETNSGTCLFGRECFIQRLALYDPYDLDGNIGHIKENIYFSGNTATVQGSNLFGGLLDRCIPSHFAELYNMGRIYYSGVDYFKNISNNKFVLDSVGSQPVRVCFCNSEHEPDCSYQLPTITVKKGAAFNVSVVAVDQVNKTVDTNISASVSSSKFNSGFGEGQEFQNVGRNCTNLTYNGYSPHNSETINLFADGPCGSAALSTSHLTIHFTDCTCPVGFQSLSNSKSSTRCECVCDSRLSPFITHCEYATSSVFRVDTTSWITYINDTDPPGYVKCRYCPFDYCKHSEDNVSINFNLPNGADTQCSYNRTGVLCGSCRGKSSLSLASSRCLPCHSYWPAVCVVILLAAILVGILLVTALLALNMTVSVGLINSFIFYADIVSAGSAVFFPSSKPSFPSVFVAWLNLDIGIDVCFIDGLDAYIKTWLQLAFPAYIISLVVMVIIASEYSPKFAGLIGKKDPVSTLATLILLSYAKLLSVTITALSYATLDYPDGKQEIVWLPDGNVKYFQGKHILLVFSAVLIIIIGLPYTILLFLWQWIVRAPRWKIFNWTRNTKLNIFIATYHVPHNSEYRYWTGLLLLVRVIFYVTTSVTESSDPETLVLSSALLIGSLILFKGVSSQRVYRKSLVNVVDTVLNYNLLVLAMITLYHFKYNTTKQTVVAYTSTIITFIIFIGTIFYHVRLLIKKKEPLEECNQPLLSSTEPSDQDPLLDWDRDETSEHYRLLRHTSIQ